MKDAQDILDEVLGAADPVEQELGLNKMFTPTIPRPSKDVEDVDADYEYPVSYTHLTLPTSG